MGAWGAGNFENDGAADWLAGFMEKKSLARLTAPLEKGLSDAEGDQWDEALVAAEIVALMRGHPAPDCPDDLRIWAQQNQATPGVELSTLARKFVAYVIQATEHPEFRKSFGQPEQADAYIAAQKKFLKRLRADFKKLPKAAGQTGGEAPRKEPWVFVGHVKINKGSSGSLSRRGENLSLPELPEVVSLEPKPDWQPTLELHLDFFFTPQELERLARLVQRNGQMLVKLVRLSGGIYLKNKDLLKLLAEIAPHVEYLDLQVNGVDLSVLSAARRMKKFRVSLNKKAKGADLKYLAGMEELDVLSLGLLQKLPGGDTFTRNHKLKYLVFSAEELDDNRLPELPESLEELSVAVTNSGPNLDLSSLTRLPRLKRLYLSAKSFRPLPAQGFESLEYCHPSTSMSDISFLSAAKNLRDLDLPPLVDNLEFLTELKELRRLEIGGGYKLDLKATDLSPLEKLPKLRTLQLHHSTMITRLPRLPKLERFVCYAMPNLPLEEIAKLPALRLFSPMIIRHDEGIVEKVKAIAPQVEVVSGGHDWYEAEPSLYNGYFF